VRAPSQHTATPAHTRATVTDRTPRAILPDRSSRQGIESDVKPTFLRRTYLQVAMPAYNGSDEVVPETERIMAETVEALASIVRSPTPLRSLCAFFLVDATSHFELENTNASSGQQLASPTSSQALHFPPLATTPPARFVWRAEGDHTAARVGQPHSWQRRRCSVTCKFHIPLMVSHNPTKPTTSQVLEALQMGLPISKSAAVSAGYEALIKTGCYLFDNKLIDSEE
jgi:hypothetical protein